MVGENSSSDLVSFKLLPNSFKKDAIVWKHMTQVKLSQKA